MLYSLESRLGGGSGASQWGTDRAHCARAQRGDGPDGGDVDGISATALGATVGMIFVGMLIGGVTGFGSSLVTTPFLLLLGVPLPLVVTANLTLVIATRVRVAMRWRAHITPRRPLLLVLGSIPGLYLGTVLLTRVDGAILKRTTGIVILLAVGVQVWNARRPPPPPIPGAPLVAGLLGGVLGVTTSLNGVPPAILLARDRLAPRAFQADLAVYFVASNVIALALLAVRGRFATAALLPLILWLPAAFLGNSVGTAMGTRLPDRTFRTLTYVIVFLAGVVTVMTA